ncbi:MAG: hypothetical protein Ta2D_07280 [Rickettsiales bacterium]|nr:MAG: hypothetical protein Ta2D_07280 [Rickettsiales bacterium]
MDLSKYKKESKNVFSSSIETTKAEKKEQKKRGRKKMEIKLEIPSKIYFSKTDYEKIENIATKNGLSVSMYIRMITLKTINEKI